VTSGFEAVFQIFPDFFAAEKAQAGLREGPRRNRDVLESVEPGSLAAQVCVTSDVFLDGDLQDEFQADVHALDLVRVGHAVTGRPMVSA